MVEVAGVGAVEVAGSGRAASKPGLAAGGLPASRTMASRMSST